MKDIGSFGKFIGFSTVEAMAIHVFLNQRLELPNVIFEAGWRSISGIFSRRYFL